MQPEQDIPQATATDEARRRFLAVCGKFALATPPAISLMLAAGERNYATAASGGGGSGGTQGNHNGGHYDHHDHHSQHGDSGERGEGGERGERGERHGEHRR